MQEQHGPFWSARFRVEAAKIRQVQGRSSDVIQLLDHNWQPEPSDPDIEAQRLILLSLAYARSGDTAGAARAIDAAGQIHGISPSVNAEIFAARARFDLEEDRLADAESLFEKSLAAARSGGNRFFESSSLLNLSVISLQQNRYEDALEQATAAAGVARILGAQVILEKAQGNAGWSLYETGDYQRALVSFNDAAASAHELGSTIDEANWLTTAGMSEARMGNYSAAQERYRRSLALARSLRNATQIVYADEALAALLLRSPQPEVATPYIHEAARLAQQKGSAFDIQLSDLLQAQLIGQTGDLSKSKALLLSVEQRAKSSPTVKLDSQHALAQVCEKMANKQQAELWFKQSIATYREQRAQLRTDDARLPFFETGRDLYMDYAAFLIRNHRTDDALNLIDQGRAETLAEGLGVQNKPDSLRRVSLRRLARQSHAVILVYALSSPSSYLWASNGKDSGFYLLPDRSVVLAAAAAHQRALLAARDLLAEQHPAARTLYDMLLKPAEQIFHPGDRVYIVGAGGLSGLNFETLLTPGPSSHYWIEDVTLTHFSSLRFLAMPSRSQPRSEPDPARILIIGNPIYAGSQYSPLPNAAQEVSGVAAHFPVASRTMLTGASASPGAYLQSDPARFAYIHFVSHATASRLVPLDSAVILSANGEQDSTKLYARDILNKPLDAELVTISACQGSGIRTYAGEGLVGLAWAFLRAGSHNVIGALWDVSDASTPELMGHLYDGIAAGQPPDVSLRAAKLELLHRRGVFRKPLYWGAFQLYSSGR
jgi:CHAT domain-containing protein